MQSKADNLIWRMSIFPLIILFFIHLKLEIALAMQGLNVTLLY